MSEVPRNPAAARLALRHLPPRGELLARIHFSIVMIRWTGLAPWEFEFPFPGSLISTFLLAARLALGHLPSHGTPSSLLLSSLELSDTQVYEPQIRARLNQVNLFQVALHLPSYNQVNLHAETADEVEYADQVITPHLLSLSISLTHTVSLSISLYHTHTLSLSHTNSLSFCRSPSLKLSLSCRC